MSVTTASFVMRDSYRLSVSPATRQRVREAALAVGYRRNLAALALAGSTADAWIEATARAERVQGDLILPNGSRVSAQGLTLETVATLLIGGAQPQES